MKLYYLLLKYYFIIILMNRSYSQSAEIDCTCFDFGASNKTLQHYKSANLKPYVNARSGKIMNQKQLKQFFQQKCQPKKSLKRKYQNLSLKEGAQNKENREKRIRHLESIKVESIELCQNKQNQPIERSFQSIIPEKQKNQKQNKINKIQFSSEDAIKMDKAKNKIFTRENIYQKKIVNSIKQVAQQHQYESTENTYKFTYKNKDLNNLDIAQIQSYAKTIKKTHSRKPSSNNQQFVNKEPHQIYRITQFKKRPSQDSPQGKNRVSLKVQNQNNFMKILYPKEIQSFQSQISADQSEVIQVGGRYTWAPDSSKKVQGVKFISSLHIRQSSRSNRPSKMFAGTYS